MYFWPSLRPSRTGFSYRQFCLYFGTPGLMGPSPAPEEVLPVPGSNECMAPPGPGLPRSAQIEVMRAPYVVHYRGPPAPGKSSGFIPPKFSTKAVREKKNRSKPTLPLISESEWAFGAGNMFSPRIPDFREMTCGGFSFRIVIAPLGSPDLPWDFTSSEKKNAIDSVFFVAQLLFWGFGTMARA